MARTQFPKLKVRDNNTVSLEIQGQMMEYSLVHTAGLNSVVHFPPQNKSGSPGKDKVSWATLPIVLLLLCQSTLEYIFHSSLSTLDKTEGDL